jgi:hypothetical protein
MQIPKFDLLHDSLDVGGEDLMLPGDRSITPTCSHPRHVRYALKGIRDLECIWFRGWRILAEIYLFERVVAQKATIIGRSYYLEDVEGFMAV